MSTIDFEKLKNDLDKQYKFLHKEVKKLAKCIKEEGTIIKSPANGAVRNPKVVVYDTFMKQMNMIIKQLIELDKELVEGSHNPLDELMED